MSVLAVALAEAMSASPHDLVVLDRTSGEWVPRPWQQVYAQAQGIAARILYTGMPGAVGLVGEPTAEFVAAIPGAWLAGRAVSSFCRTSLDRPLTWP